MGALGGCVRQLAYSRSEMRRIARSSAQRRGSLGRGSVRCSSLLENVSVLWALVLLPPRHIRHRMIPPHVRQHLYDDPRPMERIIEH